MAVPEDIVPNEKLSRVPVVVVKASYIERIGTRANWLARFCLQHPRLKHWVLMDRRIQPLHISSRKTCNLKEIAIEKQAGFRGRIPYG